MDPLEPTDPTRVGPYTLLGRLGAGGMGAVFLGRSAGGRTVAVKLIRPELADDDGFRARFRAEVSAARAVSGAFTAPVVAADPDAEAPWMATAFVPGVSLHEAVATYGPLPEAALRSLLAGIAEALANIHAAGLTHRDLKPANVLLALDGPHVIDFGIARAADGTALTAAGMVLGTPSYMSPEQARSGELTAASDVFSLGTTLAFAARGRGLFGEPDEPPLDVLRRVADEEPDLSALPPALRLTVAACLSKSPQDRPKPAQLVEFVQQLAVRIEPGGWLPAALITAIEDASSVMAPGQPTAQPADRPSEQPADQPVVQPADQAAAQALPPPSAPPPVVPPPPASPPPPAGTPQPSRRALVLGLAAGAVALAGGGGAAVALWPRGDEDDNKPPSQGSSPARGVKDPTRSLATETTAKRLWTAPVPDPMTELAGSGETVLVGTAKHVLAYDQKGRLRWGPTPLAGSADSASSGMGGNAFAVDDKHVYVLVNTESKSSSGQPSRALAALKLTDGDTAWTVKGPAPAVNFAWVPGILDDTVYVIGETSPEFELPKDPSDWPTDPSELTKGIGGRTTFIWAIDSAKKKLSWRTNYENTMVGQASLRVPSFGHRLLWVASATPDKTAPKLSALHARSRGKALWEQPAPGGGSISGTDPSALMRPWYDGPHTSAGGHFLYVSNKLYAVDPKNGQVSWQSPGQASFLAVSANADGSTVFAAGPDYQGKVLVYAFNAKTGDVRWAGSLPYSVNGALALRCADATAYLWANGQVWALDEEDGKARWQFSFDGGAAGMSGPVAFWAGDGHVYGPSEKGLTALTAKGS